MRMKVSNYIAKLLVQNGITDVFISIALDENALLICMNKSLIIPQEVFKRLKELCFD